MGSRYTVLLYHGVHADDCQLGLRNSSGKHLPRGEFARQMQWLCNNRPVVSMIALAAAHRGAGAVPDDAVAVTFDDGFLNNFEQAWPVLEEYRIPATIYLATGYIGTGRMMWTDQLEAILIETARQSVRFEGIEYSLHSGRDRIATLTAIKRAMKAMTNAGKEQSLAALRAELGVQPDNAHPLYAFMTWDHVRRMTRSPLIDFGAHTVDHVALARVLVDEMERQIDDSVAAVARETGLSCGLFSYPEGQDADYNETVISALKSRGFDHTPSAIDGDNEIGKTDPFHIRRTMVGFEARPFPMRGYYEGVHAALR
jgi:peptidoglycan/xylan/chitin deacetylase (PgdA/CDA1 family)